MHKAILFCIACCLSACFGKQPDPIISKDLAGTALPVIGLLKADSTAFSTTEIPAGKPFIIFVFGPTCPYSKTQMKEIIDNNRQLHNITVYAVTPAPHQQLKAFSDAFHLDRYKKIITATDTSNGLQKNFDIQAVPFTIVFDSNKKCKSTFLGNTSVETIMKAVAE